MEFELTAQEESVLETASVLGRELLVEAYIRRGLSEDESEALADRTLAPLAEAVGPMTDLDDAALRSLVEALGDQLDLLSQNSEVAALVERAYLASQGRQLGWGREVATAAIGLGLALLIFAKPLSTTITYSSAKGLEVSSPAGLAPGVAETIAKIGDVVEHSLKSAESISKNVAEITKNVSQITGREGGTESRALTVRKSALMSLAQGEVVLLAPGELALTSPDDAARIAGFLHDRLDNQVLPLQASNDPASLYVSPGGNKGWGRERLYTIDTGVVAVRRQDDGTVYRIAIFVQSPAKLRKAHFKTIKAEIQRQAEGLAVVRAVTREATLLDGVEISPAWARMKNGIGGPITTPEGFVGSVGVYVQNASGAEYLLTAGHVLSPGLVGRTPVYSPPSDDLSSGDEIGLVGDYTIFNRTCRSPGLSDAADIGAVKLHKGFTPEPQKRLKVDDHTLKLSAPEVVAELTGATIYKAKSRTPRAVARVRAVGVSVSLTHPVTKKCLRGDGLITATLERSGPAKPGESGCLVYDAEHRPLGLLIGGAAMQSENSGQVQQVLYVQPLAPYLRSYGWSLF
jgi:hypothetical protein